MKQIIYKLGGTCSTFGKAVLMCVCVCVCVCVCMYICVYVCRIYVKER